MKKFMYAIFNLILALAACHSPIDKFQYRFYNTINIDGYTRYYLLNLPPGYYNDTINLPLVIALHGAGGDALQCENDYQLTQKADEENYIIVYPEGVQSDGPFGFQTWNAGLCCDYAAENNIDDVQFIRLLIERLTASYKIDARRVYVTGMSNGAMMTYRLACELSDKIAAIASVSGTMMVSGTCSPSRPVPILHFHSKLDVKVPPIGGVGLAGYYFNPVDSILHVWASINSCSEIEPHITEHEGYTYKSWEDCFEETTIEYYLTNDGGHAWPGGIKSRPAADTPSKSLNANDLIWDFFQKHQLP